MKALEYISVGYQRLVTFECASGGYNWWVGDDPGNAILTAMAVMMFTDTKAVSYVEDVVIERAAAWLAERQQSDGSWTEETHLHGGNENLGAGSLRATAYITWALLHAGLEKGATSKALSHLRSEVGGETDVYTQALVALALAMENPGDSMVSQLLSKIHDARTEDGDKISWASDSSTMVHGGGNAAAIETTALVALAMMQAGSYMADAEGALNFLIASKDAQGNWGYSTQATVLALKALIASLSTGAPETNATVKVLLDGEVIATRQFDNFNGDVMWQVELAELTKEGNNVVTFEYEGVGNLMYQVTGTHYVPWENAQLEVTGPLTIDVNYDKTQLSTDDTIHVTVTVTNNDASATGMVLVDMGLPPGFDVDTTELNELKKQGIIQKVEKTAMQLLIYINEVTPETPVTLGYDLKAKYPLEATAPKSEVYFYYNKEVKAETGPIVVNVL
jgi:uncharacterized protein YfaS (alpha-2-macroglobulin family)